MSFLKGLFNREAGNFVQSIGDAFDKNFTSEEERLKMKAELMAQASYIVEKTMEMQQKLILSETSGNWLQRSWRPIVMLLFSFVVLYAYFLQPAFFPEAVSVAKELPKEFWELLTWGIGGYVIGRSGEKIASQVTINKK